MASWSEPRPERRTQTHKGDGWVLVRAEPLLNARVRLHYLLNDGGRPAVIVLEADLTDDLVSAIGDSLVRGDRRYNPQRSRWQP